MQIFPVFASISTDLLTTRLTPCISSAHMSTVSPLLFVPTVETCSFDFKKEKIKEYGVIIPALLNVHNWRLKSVLLQA